MEQENYDNSSDRKIESVFSSRVRAGKRRTYFFDVRATRANDYFLTITESRKRFDNNGYDRHKVFIYKEDFNKFIKAITEAIDFVKTELMPDFDFDAFNHEGEEPYEPGVNADERVTLSIPTTSSSQDTIVTPTENIAAAPIPAQEDHDQDKHIVITEKKPLEARDSKASEGDNLSGEEVDKW
jgi:hypothetical protein